VAVVVAGGGGGVGSSSSGRAAGLVWGAVRSVCAAPSPLALAPLLADDWEATAAACVAAAVRRGRVEGVWEAARATVRWMRDARQRRHGVHGRRRAMRAVAS
jgi:hypothetical protein